ncbi:MAG: hypothetical protein JNM07_10370 [Phycisphaerae bacterium]|nr:hypothetical protein [Phycisphaerae bacterium]
MFAIRAIACASVSGLATGAGGCAVHYFDSETQTEHVWGFTHVRMRATPAEEGVRATLTEVGVLGIGVGITPRQSYVSAGWNQVRFLEVRDDTTVRLEWPRSDFFSVRVGALPPWRAGEGAAGGADGPLGGTSREDATCERADE